MTKEEWRNTRNSEIEGPGKQLEAGILISTCTASGDLGHVEFNTNCNFLPTSHQLLAPFILLYL
jgi:hypothetical protein